MCVRRYSNTRTIWQAEMSRNVSTELLEHRSQNVLPLVVDQSSRVVPGSTPLTGDTRAVTQPDLIDRIIRPQPVEVRTVWPGESTHFTPWLAANLDWLDALGLGPLELVGTEVVLPTVNRNLDILARTPDGRRIAIENQYLKVDHDHLTRGLAYAVGHDAKALVVIAEDHGSEFIAIADYLNSAYEQLGTEKGIAVSWCR